MPQNEELLQKNGLIIVNMIAKRFRKTQQISLPVRDQGDAVRVLLFCNDYCIESESIFLLALRIDLITKAFSFSKAVPLEIIYILTQCGFNYIKPSL